MTKDQRSIVIEYAGTVSDEDLRYITSRLTERYTDDMPQALDKLALAETVDAVLGSAKSALEFFILADQVRDVLTKECKKRGVSFKQGAAA